MKNKIKPFCVNVQDIYGKGTVATEQQIRDLHKMCIDAGANNLEDVEVFLKENYTYQFKGIDTDGDTLSHRFISWFNNNLIHISQVPAHLGLDLPKDNTLVEGTLEHAYVTLKGDLSNSLNGNKNNNFVLFGKNLTMKDGYYTGIHKVDDHKWKTVCTVKEFQIYCEEQRSNSPVNCTLSDDNPSEDESPIVSVKPLKWTVCAQKQGIPLQVGMRCVDNLGIELEVKYLGDKLAIVIEVEDDRECSATVDSLLPFPKELSPEEEQREKVMEYLLTEFDEKCSEIIYGNLSKLGVFKF